MKSLFLILVLCISLPAAAEQPTLIDEVPQGHQAQTAKAPTSSLIESAFSPGGGSEALVLKVIGTAERSIRLAAYSFTSPSVVRELLAAKRRGVDVCVIVDDKGNKGKASVAALNLLASANIPTRTLSVYAIHHDKYVVADERHVQNGSFNYSQAAAKSNSENVLVVWNNPGLAADYLRHWQSRWEEGVDYSLPY